MATKSSKTEKTTTVKKSSFAENYGSTILGFIVVLILGSFLFNVFRGNNQDGQVGNGEDNQNEEQSVDGQKHVVAAGEDLWKISVKYYNTGYNWTDIAKANNITDANQIEEGMTLTIPVVTPQGPTEIAQAPTTSVVPTEMPAATATQAPTTTVAVTVSPTATIAPAAVTPQPSKPAGQGGTYTVQKGDSLWTIAEKEYNDGYKWVEIARANKLENPDFIHVGNMLTLPR